MMWPGIWSLALAGLLLGPALGPGYVLSYDLVWVPDLAFRGDFLGLSTGLPRAVPSDAVVSVLDEVVPSQLLQKLMLAGFLVAAGVGTARLVRPGPGATLARLVAVTLVVWNPFVVERLVIGHWPVLVGYGVLPWLVAAARTWRVEGRPPPQIWVLAPLGSLSASAGVVTAVVVLAFALTGGARRWLGPLGLVAAANAPWVVAGLLHAGSAVTDASGAGVFGLSGEGSLPAPLTALSLGGIWNGEAVPSSRTGFQAWVALVLLVALVALGARSWWRHEERRDALAFVGCWGAGMTVALLTWAVPDAVGWLVQEVPGAGLFRDGSRTLALCAPLLVLVAAEGARRIWCRVTEPPVLRAVVGATLVVLPVSVLPDAAWGVAGRLVPVDYPASWATARDVVEDAHASRPGDVLLLPLTSYRAPAWLDGGKILDPMGRYLTPDYVAADDLVVSGVRVSGEDARVRDVRRALALPSPESRAEALAALGIGYVVLEPDAFGPAPEVAGEVLLDEPDVRVTALGDVTERTTPTGRVVALALAWSAYVASVVVGSAACVVAARRRRHTGSATSS
ncbi:hypothetical protein GCM10023146_09100 [Nocardioides caricicola]